MVWLVFLCFLCPLAPFDVSQIKKKMISTPYLLVLHKYVLIVKVSVYKHFFMYNSLWEELNLSQLWLEKYLRSIFHTVRPEFNFWH